MENNNVEVTPMPYVPEEIWRVILFKLERAKDYKCCTGVCRSWNSILEPFRIFWLRRVIFPNLLLYMSAQDFLQCRLICKEWKDQVDFFLVNHFFHRPQPPLNDYGSDVECLREKSFIAPLRRTELDRLYFHGSTTIDDFRDIMRHHTGNPFIGRSISLVYSKKWEDSSIIPFLDAFGRHVWHLQLLIMALPLDFIRNLENCLKRTPNLRSLKITGDPLSNPGGIFFDSKIHKESDAPWNIVEFKKYLRSHPPPTLIHLDSLEFGLVEEPIAQEIISWVLAPNLPELRRLTMECLSDFLKFSPSHQLELPRLTELCLVVSTNQQLVHLSRLTCPLRRLYLHMDNVQNLDVQTVSGTISNFGETLRVLHLYITEDWDFSFDFKLPQESDPEALQFFPAVNLPRLVTLELSNCLTISSRMLCSESLRKNLKYLHLYYCTIDFIPFREEIEKFERYLGNGEPKEPGRLDLEDSGVWRRFPKLRKVTLEKYEVQMEVCTREMFDYFQNHKVLN